jgi:phage gp45-like
MIDVKQIIARIRNLFRVSEYQLRYGDGRIQVKTRNGKTLEKREAFPYGFIAKAKSGKALVLCQGGNYSDFEILPVADGSAAPELKDGDAAVYTAGGGTVILRAESGKIFIGNGQADMCALLTALVDQIENIGTFGQPGAHTIDGATRQNLETFKNEIKNLFEGGAYWR